MVKRIFISSLVVGVLMSSAVFQQTAYARILVTQTDSEIPYESKGFIEAEEKPELLLNRIVHIFTLGALSKKEVDVVKSQLNDKLAKKAKLYSVDAIINVEYSPDPSDPRFLKSKKVYAKGNMIKYKKAYTY